MSNGKNKKKRLIIISVVAVAVIALVIVAVAATRGGTKIDPTKLAKVEKGDLAKSVVATGKVTPITKVEIKSKASGIVTKLYVDAGDTVKQGQVLAELDRVEIQAAVNSARAQLLSSQANQQAAEADTKRAEVDAQGVDIPTLQRNYERMQEMAKSGVVSTSALDDSQRAYILAVNKRDVAKAQLVVNRAKVAQAAADVQKNNASLKQLEEQLSYTTIVAPIDGIILSRDVEMGDAVSSILVMGSAATLVMTIGDTSEVYVKGKVDESDIGKVYLGQPARIRVETFKDKTFNGKVTKISPMGTEKDNVTTFEVRVSITNPGGELKAEMTANAEIILDEHKNVLMIPEGAILYDKDKKASTEVPDPKAKEGKRKVALNIGISNGAKTEVLSGVKEGDQVVLQQ
ncbi:MAG TPA: efflux RND transporter periplasmic adaptor subunit [Candidatus Angelobacter sp.]|nr:efflux RND transporter periplasmic adaptor subunit [Candidatus Angelobacter sp.]